jgi:L-rhamnose mutarotase
MNNMESKRICMALDLKDDPDLIEAYQNIHHKGQIWPEIPIGIRDSGVLDMQIYRTGNHLFMIVEIPKDANINEVFDQMGKFPRQQEWAQYMNTFQQRLQTAKPDEHWAVMSPVFLLNDHI